DGGVVLGDGAPLEERRGRSAGGASRVGYGRSIPGDRASGESGRYRVGQPRLDRATGHIVRRALSYRGIHRCRGPWQRQRTPGRVGGDRDEAVGNGPRVSPSFTLRVGASRPGARPVRCGLALFLVVTACG